MLEDLVHRIDNLLPQTQCKQCGFEGCLPYAKAMAEGQADLNQCPPGGLATIESLASLLGKPTKPVDPSCGITTPRHIASIQAEHCIGCTLCIQACPVDAIVGAAKQRHAVLAALCTGCELCIPPCPVDCIDMVFLPEHSDWNTTMAHEARARMHQRDARLVRQKEAQADRLEQKAIRKLGELNQQDPQNNNAEQAKKRAVVEAALARARARRAGANP
ncbi:RnfABCDGE type electron transport complex subunit B [Limnobacter sp.]|uniref:RnfABCDGE type electron transport complex subunit B n=1 Tax=Limnobacter sp. TaxID=2003368 RepID=UPI0035188F65